MHQGLRVALALGVLLTALAAGFYPTLLTWMATRLAVVDPLQHADAIVVLAGESGERVVEGVHLWREGWAPLIVMSGGLGEGNVTLAELMRRQAVSLGVDEHHIVVQDRSTDTGEDARYVAQLARQRGFHRVLLVTSPYHARRALWLFRRELAGTGIEVVSRPVRASWFRTSAWWTRKADRKVVLMEYLKEVWYVVTGG
jgi:uncharacterized SAM-binding protein YcdF (DUF218 family)